MDDPRFWAKVKKLPTGCWEWQGSRDPKGYGHLNRGAKTGWLAHRRSWFLTNGSLPDGPLDHLCGNPPCVNPAHLEPVTTLINNRRSTPHNRTKTHCPKGHEYTPENTRRVFVRGVVRQRQCRLCRAEYVRNLRARHRREDPVWAEREREINREHYARNSLNPEWRAKENARTLAAYHRQAAARSPSRDKIAPTARAEAPER